MSVLYSLSGRQRRKVRRLSQERERDVYHDFSSGFYF
jgi:hypothetical protein